MLPATRTSKMVAVLCALHVLFNLHSPSGIGFAQQVADPTFNPPITKPAYAQGRGPLVLIDEAHHNFHTAEGRYLPLAELLRRDGYVVRASKELLSKETLKGARVLIVANAIAERNINDWSLPTPSAFTDAEIAAVRDWVKAGGSLFLIADHMPAAGAAEKLAGAFGVSISNGFAMDEKNMQGGTMVFKRSDNSLKEHPVTKGRTPAEKIESVATFTGSAFQVTASAQPLLVFGPSIVSLTPKTAWQFTPETPRVGVAGWSQGAVMRLGKGRVAVFGEAAMFTAQLAGPNRIQVGMNAPPAKQNAQFLLNLMHWLSGLLN